MTTDAIDPAVPLAETLDEAGLRAVFPGAPADLAVPRDVGSIFRARMKGVGGDRHGLYVWGSVALAVVGLVFAFAGMPVVCGGLVTLLGLAWIIIAFWQHSQAADDFYGSYARARGLSHDDDDPHIGADVPLFEKGDKRDWSHVMEGRIAGHDARLGHFTYTIVTRDSEGNRQEQDHDYTVLAFRLPEPVADRYRGVYLAPKGWLSLGKLGDRFSHARGVELESAEFAKRYSLRVVDDQDDVALYELFSTTFVHRLATDLEETYWEQVGRDLVCYSTGHDDETVDLDRFCQRSGHVLQRYLEEHR